MNDESKSSGGSSSASKGSSNSNAGLVLLIIMGFVLLPLAGLLICYWRASQEGLMDVLKAMKPKRDKARKRRGASAGGGFRQRQKLSQDGKGGRSANS